MGRVSDAKDRLLDAAMELVWRNSYGAVSVDDICKAANVKKGSFYHFFPQGKDELVAASLRRLADEIRPDYDAVFSASVPPLERLHGFFELVKKRQADLHAEAGRVLGCPFSSLGTEVISADAGLREAVQGLVKSKLKYLENALRDAMAEGLVAKGDPTKLAQSIYLFLEGSLAQARIQNDLSYLDALEEGCLRLLGVQAASVT
jgi:TetR/AcrR family transcriptional regulator, transcriptional repressor for nem operon